MHVTSADGYIRMSLAELQSTALTHLLSNLDEMYQTIDRGPASPITGYSEWISSGTPAITLGWDWHLALTRETVELRLLETPRSNVMLVNQHGADLGVEMTKRLLAGFIDALPWRGEVMQILNLYPI